MLKRLGFFTLILGFLVTLFVPASLAFAEGSQSKVVLQNKEIKDIDKLLQRAKNNVTDLPNHELPEMAKQKASLSGDKTSKEIGTINTTQLLKKEILPNGKQKRSFATTNFAEITERDIELTGSQGDSGEDRSISVRAYSTIYYDTVRGPNGKTHYDLKRITGGWTRLDSTVFLTNRRVEYGAEGWSAFGYAKSGQDATRYPSNNSYSYSAPSSWYPIVTNAGWYSFGTSSKITISRRSSSWNFTFSNTK